MLQRRVRAFAEKALPDRFEAQRTVRIAKGDRFR
jgi:hypothetical protein